MKIVLAFAFALVALGAQANDSFHEAVQPALPAHPALYSFADLYRLTVGTAPLGVLPLNAPDAPLRVATQPSSAPEAQFSIARVPEPSGWVLLLSGLALALWVARRRVVHSY